MFKIQRLTATLVIYIVSKSGNLIQGAWAGWFVDSEKSLARETTNYNVFMGLYNVENTQPSFFVF